MIDLSILTLLDMFGKINWLIFQLLFIADYARIPTMPSSACFYNLSASWTNLTSQIARLVMRSRMKEAVNFHCKYQDVNY